MKNIVFFLIVLYASIGMGCEQSSNQILSDSISKNKGKTDQSNYLLVVQKDKWVKSFYRKSIDMPTIIRDFSGSSLIIFNGIFAPYRFELLEEGCEYEPQKALEIDVNIYVPSEMSDIDINEFVSIVKTDLALTEWLFKKYNYLGVHFCLDESVKHIKGRTVALGTLPEYCNSRLAQKEFYSLNNSNNYNLSELNVIYNNRDNGSIALALKKNSSIEYQESFLTFIFAHEVGHLFGLSDYISVCGGQNEFFYACRSCSRITNESIGVTNLMRQQFDGTNYLTAGQLSIAVSNKFSLLNRLLNWPKDNCIDSSSPSIIDEHCTPDVCERLEDEDLERLFDNFPNTEIMEELKRMRDSLDKWFIEENFNLDSVISKTNKFNILIEHVFLSDIFDSKINILQQIVQTETEFGVDYLDVSIIKAYETSQMQKLLQKSNERSFEVNSNLDELKFLFEKFRLDEINGTFN